MTTSDATSPASDVPDGARSRAADPTVTCVIPCYNHGRFVGEAVRSCLDQTDADIRVVVVDDGSPDGTTPGACDEAGAADERVTVIHQTNTGLPGARNRGAAGATTDYLCFLDADDFIDAGFVTTLHSAMRDDGEDDCSHAFCQERLVERHTGIWEVPDWDPALLMVTNLHPVTALLRRDRFEDVGGFDDTMTDGYEDWDLWLRFAARGWRGVRVREPLFNWRRHSEVTMITEAGERHARLFARLVENHRELYLERADELLILSNELLRRGEANWIDERGEAIVLRDTRRHVAWVEQECDRLQRELGAAHDATVAARAETEALRAGYEAKPVIRLSRALHRLMEALPSPLARVSRRIANTAKRAAPSGPERP